MMEGQENRLTLFLGRHKTRSAGLWVYGVELFNTYCELAEKDEKILNSVFPLQIVYAGEAEHDKDIERIKLKYADLPIRIVKLDDFKKSRKLGVILDAFQSIKNTKVLHATSNILPLLGTSKKILTMHDLFQAFPSKRMLSNYDVFRNFVFKILFKLQFKKSDYVVTDLQSVQDEIRRHYKNVDNMVTILPGLKKDFISTLLPQKENKSSYILAFASQDPRKNIRRVIDAFIKTNFLEDISLRIVASSKELKKQLEIFLDANNIGNIDVLTNIKDDEMPFLYQDARALIFPSIAEGFGFPIYEALSQGIPVVAPSNLTIEEVRQEVRPFVIECDPLSEESIQNAMLRVVASLQRVEKRQRVAEYIREKFNFENAARMYLSLYSK